MPQPSTNPNELRRLAHIAETYRLLEKTWDQWVARDKRVRAKMKEQLAEAKAQYRAAFGFDPPPNDDGAGAS